MMAWRGEVVADLELWGFEQGGVADQRKGESRTTTMGKGRLLESSIVLVIVVVLVLGLWW
jgi:hypothetical protein